MKITKEEIRAALKTERKQLIALVSKASEEQLNTASLCEGWNLRGVLGHIIGFELSRLDVMKLLLKIEGLDAINNTQSKRYQNCTSREYVRLLKRGHKRLLGLVRLTPKSLLNIKFIPVPNGRLSIAQLFGDVVMDRAIHYLDIAKPLSISSKVTESEVMLVSLKFILKSIDLLNPNIPDKYYDSFAELKLSGLCGATYYWKLGTSGVEEKIPSEKAVLSVSGDTNDFLFTITGRQSLIHSPLTVMGDKELEHIFRTSLHANKLWEH